MTQTRDEMLARRAKNKLAAELMPIALRQARNLSSQSGANYEDLLGEAIRGISVAIANGDPSQAGFYRYVKLCVKGYMFNWLRDQSRNVRLPRAVSLAYMSEQKHLRSNRTEYSALTDEQKATVCGCTLLDLQESRTAITLHSTALDGVDRDHNNKLSTKDLGNEADLVQQIVTLGARALANRSRQTEASVTQAFYVALAAIVAERT